MNKIIHSFFTLIIVLSLVSCDDSKKTQAPLSAGDDRAPILAFGSFIQTATGGSGTGSITYESNNLEVATVNMNTGEVTPLSLGTVIITATKKGDSTYALISDGYTVKVLDKPSLKVTFNGVKTFKFSWPNIQAESYRLLEDSDGSGSFSEVGEDILEGEISFNLLVPLYKRLNASYKIRGCKGLSTCVESDSIDIDVNNLVDSIGYFKASNTGESDSFGYRVSLSGDGRTLAVGAFLEDSNARGVNEDENNNSASNSGAVYVFTRTETGWTQQAYIKASNTDENDSFGYRVSLSGDGRTLAVGARGEDSNVRGVNEDENNNSASNSGAVYVFTRTGTDWTQEAYIKASNTGANDIFGTSISLSGDGSTLAVGAQREGSNARGVNEDENNNSASNSGAVYVFTRTGTTWAQQAYIKASNTGGSDEFGSSISLSSDGSTLAVGAYNEDSNARGVNEDENNNSASNSGAVYVFTRTGTDWTQEAYIKASNTGEGDFFGYSVSLSGGGGTLAVGAVGEDSNVRGVNEGENNNSASNSGAVYVFTRTGTDWTQEAYIKASNTDGGDFFSNSVSLSDNGSTLAVGAYFEDSNREGINEGENNNSALNSGAVYVFTRTGTTWAQQAYIKASNTGGDDEFGSSISLSSDGNTLAVGAEGEDSNAEGVNKNNNSAESSGAVYLY